LVVKNLENYTGVAIRFCAKISKKYENKNNNKMIFLLVSKNIVTIFLHQKYCHKSLIINHLIKIN